MARRLSAGDVFVRGRVPWRRAVAVEGRRSVAVSVAGRAARVVRRVAVAVAVAAVAASTRGERPTTFRGGTAAQRGRKGETREGSVKEERDAPIRRASTTIRITATTVVSRRVRLVPRPSTALVSRIVAARRGRTVVKRRSRARVRVQRRRCAVRRTSTGSFGRGHDRRTTETAGRRVAAISAVRRDSGTRRRGNGGTSAVGRTVVGSNRRVARSSPWKRVRRVVGARSGTVEVRVVGRTVYWRTAVGNGRSTATRRRRSVAVEITASRRRTVARTVERWSPIVPRFTVASTSTVAGGTSVASSASAIARRRSSTTSRGSATGCTAWKVQSSVRGTVSARTRRGVRRCH